jgi:hypothetical protein
MPIATAKLAEPVDRQGAQPESVLSKAPDEIA